MFEQLLESIQFLSPQQSQGLANFGDKLKSIGNPAAFQEEQKSKLMQLQQEQAKREMARQDALSKITPEMLGGQSGIEAYLTQAATIDPSLMPELIKYKMAKEQAMKPDWKVQEVDGALVRYNANDPTGKVETVFNGGGKPQTNVAKLKADLDKGLIDKETYDRALAKEVAPTEKNYKQFQLQNAAFADMMVNASNTLAPLEDKLVAGEFSPVNKTSKFLAAIPSLGLGEAAGNVILSDEQQKYKQAQEAWVRAKLRKESGAAIGVKEMDDEIKTFFPSVGDSPAVIAQKAQMRDEATKSMIKQTSGAYDDMYGANEIPKPAKDKDALLKRIEELKKKKGIQ